MYYIPSDILCDILRRLPADALLRFRYVCKAWRRIIDDPSFVRCHSIQQSDCSSLLIRDHEGGCLFFFSLETLNHTKDGDQTIEAAPVEQLVTRSVPRIYPFPAADCNGLILINDFDLRRNWVIWNPLTRDLHNIPPPDPELLGGSEWYLNWSLGYDRAADDYKVVRIHRILRMDRNREVVFKTLVYSLKLVVWRVSKDFPCEIRMGKGVYLNGSLYWRSRENEIIVLDVGTEEYSRLQGPPLPARCSHEHLEVMGGCLIFSCYDVDMGGLEGWIMGVENSWVKLFLFRAPKDYYMKPVAYLRKKGLVVMQELDETLFLFDLESNTLRKVSIEGMPIVSSMQFGQGSLFRLNNNINGGGAVAALGIERKRAPKRWTIQVWKTCF